MILVAFVLVLFATVMLIIGTFFDSSTAYIWISIGACLATFVVLSISYMARRRGQDDESARPAPLAADTSRSAASPRSSTSGGTATMVRDEPATETGEDEESSVRVVPGQREEAAALVDAADTTTEDATPEDGEDLAEAAPTPAPRRVAPRRVVRRAAPAASTPVEEPVADQPDAEESSTGEAAPVAAQPRIVATSPRPSTPPVDDEAEAEHDTEPTVRESADDAPAAAAPTDTTEADDQEQVAAPATRKVVRRVAPSSAGAKKVVRRVAPSGDGTRKVVRRATSGTSTSGATRRVVRRPAAGSAAGTAGARTVKRVVRSSGEAPAKPAASKPAASNRTGTRGKRARAVLSEIKGVGPAKQDALLKKFGSLEQMAEASVEDLAAIKGVGEASAAEIKRVLQDR